VYAQTEKLTLKREKVSMLDIIFAVEKQSKMMFVFCGATVELFTTSSAFFLIITTFFSREYV